VGNTGTMKRMGRAGRVNVKQKQVEIKSNQPSAAAQTYGCAQKRQNLYKTFLMEPTSLEMFSTPI
jgi:hypothetical protein